MRVCTRESSNQSPSLQKGAWQNKWQTLKEKKPTLNFAISSSSSSSLSLSVRFLLLWWDKIRKKGRFFSEEKKNRFVVKEKVCNMNEKANVSKELNAKHRKVSLLCSFDAYVLLFYLGLIVGFEISFVWWIWFMLCGCKVLCFSTSFHVCIYWVSAVINRYQFHGSKIIRAWPCSICLSRYLYTRLFILQFWVSSIMGWD